jgi:uncharacterized protein
MKDMINPFPIVGYHGKELFCDREEETKKILTNINNGIHTSLLSVRRMGKTGLIYNVFELLQSKKNVYCIYTDIYATQSLRDFTNRFGSAILKTFPEQKSIGKKFMQFIKGLRPVISFESLTSQPQLSFEYTRPKEYEHSLESIFSFLEKQNKTIVVAIDEFQQIASYPEKNTEALLRTLIQPLKNLRFIFSGSSKHLLHDIFSNSKRPFFASTQPLFLEAINKDKYILFIEEKFFDYKRKINDDALLFIVEWSRRHTYYTQTLCNRIFASGTKNIKIDDVHAACNSLLQEHEHIFFQYRQLLTSMQWDLLRAIAIEEKVYQPSSRIFISKYEVGTPANIQRTLEALLNKEMVFRDQDNNGSFYIVYDCFLSRWLEHKY